MSDSSPSGEIALDPEFVRRYRSYQDLPSLAGLGSFSDAIVPGLSVEECVRRLKRYHYALKRLFFLFNAKIAAEPIYELKMGFSLHAHLCGEHVSALRDRVGEMREPPLRLDVVPHPELERFFDEILAAPRGPMLAGLYEVALPALKRGLERHRRETHPVADHPSLRVVRFALLEIEDMIAWGGQCLSRLVSAADRTAMAPWLDLLRACLAAAGDLDGTEPEVPRPAELSPIHSATPFVYDRVPKRDERFPDPYNMGVHAEEFLYDPKFPARDKVLMMFYKRLREIDVPEMMASIILETPGKPWRFYRDMGRQLWDEARHAMMGEIGFVSQAIDWPGKVLINFTWSLGLNTQLTPQERHAVLYFIEQGLMPRTGKRFEWEVGHEARNPLAELFQDYDWADEVLHARIGRDWYVPEFSSPAEAVEYGSQCWSKVVSGWHEWKRDGLTEHRNWWPDLYTAACKARGESPDPAVLAYARDYSASRADLEKLPASG